MVEISARWLKLKLRLTSQRGDSRGDHAFRVPIGGTYVISGNAIQIANGQFGIKGSASIAVQGNSITTTETCQNVPFDPATVSPDAPTATFTATPTTLTFFRPNSAANNPNPDRVEVFTRR